MPRNILDQRLETGTHFEEIRNKRDEVDEKSPEEQERIYGNRDKTEARKRV